MGHVKLLAHTSDILNGMTPREENTNDGKQAKVSQSQTGIEAVASVRWRLWGRA
jgi:hypothetical protein